jgi:NADPH-dependent curcumin reductase CurA
MFKKWVLSNDAPVLTSKGHHDLSEKDFELLEEHTSDVCKGEILCRALFLSVDPITRLYLSYGIGPGETVPGRQVARVIESRNKKFPNGKVYIAAANHMVSRILKSQTPIELFRFDMI